MLRVHTKKKKRKSGDYGLRIHVVLKKNQKKRATSIVARILFLQAGRQAGR